MPAKSMHREIYGGRDPRDLPAYTPPEAARYLHVPPSTLRAWCFGQDSWNRSNRFQPVVEVADVENRLLSFRNLVELHVLSSIRRRDVPLRYIRELVARFREEFSSDHPLADANLATDGAGQLLVEIAGRVFNVSREWQQEMRPIVDRYLRRIARDPEGVPIKLFPFTTSRTDDERMPVVIDPRLQFGRPCLVGTGIPVDVLVERFEAGDTIDLLAEDYGRDRQEIEEAIRFDHRARAAA